VPCRGTKTLDLRRLTHSELDAGCRHCSAYSLKHRACGNTFKRILAVSWHESWQYLGTNLGTNVGSILARSELPILLKGCSCTLYLTSNLNIRFASTDSGNIEQLSVKEQIQSLYRLLEQSMYVPYVSNIKLKTTITFYRLIMKNTVL
jgi:hypothetical protein